MVVSVVANWVDRRGLELCHYLTVNEKKLPYGCNELLVFK